MEKPNSARYLYHANAVALGGQITSPFNEVIEAQASSVLPITGGYASARVEMFRYRELVSFGAAYSTVIGSETKQDDHSIIHTLSTVTVERLNVAGVVTADAVVARLVSRVDLATNARTVTAVGSHFVNLRIAGFRFELQPSPILIEDASLPQLRNACAADRSLQSLGHALDYIQAFVDGTLKQPVDREPKAVASLFALPRDRAGNSIGPAGCGARDNCGIRVPGFGTAFIGEFYISPFARQLTMLRIEMGCPVGGGAVVCILGGNGSPQ